MHGISILLHFNTFSGPSQMLLQRPTVITVRIFDYERNSMFNDVRAILCSMTSEHGKSRLLYVVTFIIITSLSRVQQALLPTVLPILHTSDQPKIGMYNGPCRAGTICT